jgi:CBS domain-containing protein
MVMTGLDTELEEVLKAMEASFHVRLIGTFDPDLVWAPAEAGASTWLAENNPDFDQFPVRDGDATVGILLRLGDHKGKTIREAMQPLREGLIVSADMPIADLIPQLCKDHYRLVLRGGRIDGLVTQSDLLKLPVRLVVFALITHLEQVMADVVSTSWPNDSWFEKLSEGRQDKILEKEKDLRSRGMNPPKIELTEFGDKRNLCKPLVSSNRSQFEKELKSLRDLRDQIAHASTFVDRSDGKTGVAAFVDKFESAKRWIDELTKLLTKAGEPS